MLFDIGWIRKEDLMENNSRLYLITPESLDPVGLLLPSRKRWMQGMLDVFSFRLKGRTREQIIQAGIDILRPIAQERDVAFLVNDYPELAAQTGCDGACGAG